ncbi:lipase-like protein [Leptotrombidium deliense]|uniref:Lipase-like protein n=1 Tax=Leptotrombidium deliense TaxID=299467 RepID=A0A443SCR3_9ACAR|nr:lipase-like protein [Leptotrombidium deliense]
MRSSVCCSLLILFAHFAAVILEKNKALKCVGREIDPPVRKEAGFCPAIRSCSFLRGGDDCLKNDTCDCDKHYVRGYTGDCISSDDCIDDYKKHIQRIDEYKREPKLSRTYKLKKPTFHTEHVLCYDDLGCFDRHTVSDTVPQNVEVIDAHISSWSKRKVFDDYLEKGSRVQMYPLPENFIPNQFISRLVVMSHGFKQSGSEPIYPEIRDLFLENNIDLVLMLHWGDNVSPWEYPAAASYTEIVGRMLGLILARWTRESVITSKSVHLWGYSLGAHLSNFAAKFYTSLTYKKIRRLTLMDAAGPYFDNPLLRPTSDSAEFVEAYHTSGGQFITPVDTLTTYKFGIATEMGHTDFYINSGTLHDGVVQPGCDTWIPHPPCSHSTANKFFKSSFKCSAVSIYCDSYGGYMKRPDRECKLDNYSILGLKAETADGVKNQYINTASQDICDIIEYHKKLLTGTHLKDNPYKQQSNTCVKLIG